MTLGSEVISWAEERCGGKVVDVQQQIHWRAREFLLQPMMIDPAAGDFEPLQLVKQP